ncbi:hypothetical protein FOA52_002139 [Chlamydomonas sp. UWO 241]|nr:hypothetical protein FOA52_002139 [Chlamydomonas sp. UWO 241]
MRLAAKKAAMEDKSEGKGEAVEPSNAGKRSGVGEDKPGVNRASKLAGAKQERLAALREKAQAMAKGAAPTF